jgi:P4 family phage/plasmid primase-like protien
MSVVSALTFTDRALAAVRRGFSIIPCQPCGKEPLARNGAKSRVNTEEGVHQFASQVPVDANYGICSDERFSILETDDRERFLAAIGQPIPRTFCVSARPNRGYWIFAQTSKSLAVSGNPMAAGLFEWRRNNQYCVGFDSIHPQTKKEYRLAVDIPPVPFPDWLVDKLLELSNARQTPIPVTDEPGPFTYENVLDMLVALQKREPRFDFEDGKPTAGPGWNVRCWNEDQHSNRGGGGLNSSTVVWVNERGFADAHCSHNHCGYGWKEFVENWKISDLQRTITNPLTALLGSGAGMRTEEGSSSSSTPSPKLFDPKPPAIIHHFTDLGNALRFLSAYGDIFRHTTARGWHSWDGKRWVPEARAAVVRAAAVTVRGIVDEIGLITKEDEKEDWSKSLRKWSRSSESKSRIEAMIGLAQSMQGIAVSVNDFDQDDWLFNCQNGTVDLRTGELLPHTREHLLTAISPITYVENAKAPRWLSFLDRVMEGDEAMINFLARAVGYTLTGSNREQCFFINHGKGANGKSTFMETVKHVLGNYGTTTPMTTFMDKKNPGIPNDLAALRNSRLVLASEAERTTRIAESLIKALTGGEQVAARFLHGEFFEFTPKFKIWLGTNHQPQIVGTDDGIWRRVNLIKWGVTIPKEERDMDLSAKLMEEGSGILAWALAGLEQYLKNGLDVPEKVRVATQEYREEEDSLGRFLVDECVTGPSSGEAQASEIYAAYRGWCDSGKERPLMQKLFKLEMERKGFPQKRSHRGTFYQDVSLSKKTRNV